MLDWARHIREYRLLHGLKQSALAERLGVDQATISRWERGLQQPDLAVQRKLRALVGLDSEVPAAVLDRVVRHSINHMVLLNETLHIQAASQRFAEMLDLRLDQIESRHLDEWLAPETRHMLDRAIADGLLEGRMLAAQFPARLVRLGNGDIHAIQVWHPFRLVDGAIRLMVEHMSTNGAHYHQELETDPLELRGLVPPSDDTRTAGPEGRADTS